MKILINATNLSKGGGVQVGLSLIRHFNLTSKHDFKIIISQAINDQLTYEETLLPHISIISKNESITQKLINRLRLIELEKKYLPDVVVTIFGPSFWRPKAKHIVGYAIPHYIYEQESPFFKKLNLIALLKLKILKNIQLSLFKYNSDYYYSETEDCSERVSKLLGKRCLTIPNTLNQFFKNVECESKILSDQMEILCIGANYPHKNLQILPKVRDALRKYKFDFRIHLTIKHEEFSSKFHDDKNFINHGEVPLSKLVNIYQKGSILLFPTLLECFSATYLEASYFYLPILTSDLSFAKTICGNNAEYFNPSDSEEIAKKIFTIYEDKKLYANLSKKSRKIYENSISSKERAKKLMDYCEDIYLNG